MRHAYMVSRPIKKCRDASPPCKTRLAQPKEITMNLSKLSQITFVGVCVGSFICSDARGQITGSGTTGSTAGSGMGNGSAGVMTGGGPDPRNLPTPYQETITESGRTMTVVRPAIQRKKAAKLRKRSKKIRSKTSTTQNARVPADTAATSPMTARRSFTRRCYRDHDDRVVV